MVNQRATVNGPPIMKCLIEGIEHEARMSDIGRIKRSCS